MSISTSVHMLIDQPLIDRNGETYPSFTVRDLPPTEIDSTSFTLTLTGDPEDRRAVAEELREIADFIEAWERSSAPASESIDAVPA